MQVALTIIRMEETLPSRLSIGHARNDKDLDNGLTLPLLWHRTMCFHLKVWSVRKNKIGLRASGQKRRATAPKKERMAMKPEAEGLVPIRSHIELTNFINFIEFTEHHL
ncbi:hypothetical protein PoB_000900800 [Plakobranchus ocellatus]|uniref:Uncharacterized protein n=1 Tax=Plakobranchus ocellatus TaxID=259542 RepID=A0AAV3YJ11_9GAST|nr:hypothetical protein PoB_000900800 [Plakobranchus ocellatus]